MILIKYRLNDVWGPFAFVFSPIFKIMKPSVSANALEKVRTGSLILEKENAKIPSFPQISPRSSLTVCDEELILTTLVSKINELTKKFHKDFNPIAQATPFYLSKTPTGELADYLNYQNFTTLNGNFYILADAVRIFEKVTKKRSEIIHQNTIHRYFSKTLKQNQNFGNMLLNCC